MKFAALLATALMAGLLSAPAATQNLAATTNANPEVAMTALFGNPVIVKGNGFEIKQGDLDEVMSGAKANAAAANQTLPPDFGISVLDQLIAIQTLLQTATPADQAAGQQDADEQFTNILKKFPSPEAFERQLQAAGMTVAELRSKATQEAVAKAALKRALNINITDDQARDFYGQHPADFEQPERVHVRHILLMTIDPTTRPPAPLSTDAIAAKHKQIEELRKRILAGEDFATLAKQYSEDPGSKETGGELPEFERGRMVPEFESAAFALEPGQMSDVVTSQYGYHLIKLLDRTPAKKIDFTAAEPEIKDGLARLKIGKLAPDYVKKLREQEQVEILDPNLKAEEAQAQAQAAATAAEAAAMGTNN